jgi:hypothetical protein
MLYQMSDTTNNWPELAIGLYDKLTGRGAEISYEFDNFELHVPSSTSTKNDPSEMAPWRMNGTLRITTRDKQNAGDSND